MVELALLSRELYILNFGSGASMRLGLCVGVLVPLTVAEALTTEINQPFTHVTSYTPVWILFRQLLIFF